MTALRERVGTIDGKLEGRGGETTTGCAVLSTNGKYVLRAARQALEPPAKTAVNERQTARGKTKKRKRAERENECIGREFLHQEMSGPGGRPHRQEARDAVAGKRNPDQRKPGRWKKGTLSRTGCMNRATGPRKFQTAATVKKRRTHKDQSTATLGK